MSAISEILQSHASTGQARTNSTAKSDSTTDSSSSTSTASATISANDFLTLLVTELKNQDPTAATDPNEYVNQLVSVNSLEQLISINTTLTDTLGSTTSSSTSTTAEKASAEQASAAITARSSASLPATSGLAPGNLSIPAASQAASAVASALSGQH